MSVISFPPYTEKEVNKLLENISTWDMCHDNWINILTLSYLETHAAETENFKVFIFSCIKSLWPLLCLRIKENFPYSGCNDIWLIKFVIVVKTQFLYFKFLEIISIYTVRLRLALLTFLPETAVPLFVNKDMEFLVWTCALSNA